jgi:hypothetical protein
MHWIDLGALFVALVGVAMILLRKPAAHMQAMLAGGSMPPGCAVAEGIALIVLAIVIAIVERG